MNSYKRDMQTPNRGTVTYRLIAVLGLFALTVGYSLGTGIATVREGLRHQSSEVVQLSERLDQVIGYLERDERRELRR